MNDVVINAIQQKIMTLESLTFTSLRQIAGRDMNAQASLNRGRAIIDCPTLLNQYLYSYGLMVQRQWSNVVPNIVEMLSDNNDQDIHLYDYGCGQGLATFYFIAVSNDRNCYGGTSRLESIFDALMGLEAEENEIFNVTHAQFERFSDEKNMNHVYFCLKIEIN